VRVPLTDRNLTRIDARTHYFDDDLMGTRSGLFHLNHSQNLEWPVLVVANGSGHH
jgi:hypothetical protein